MFFRILRESFLFAWDALRANKLRTLLSLLGVTIGIFSIIAVLTATDALENKMKADVQTLGDNVVYVGKWPWLFGDDYPWWKFMNRPIVSYTELNELKNKLSTASAVAFVADIGGQTIKYKNSSIENADVVCASYDYQLIKNFEISEGRYFTETEVNGGRAICIIGSEVYSNLFQSRNAIGEEISARGRKLTVIGVLKKEGSSMVGNSSDDVVLVPINYARNIVNLRNDNMDPTIQIKARPGIYVEELKDEVRGTMRGLRRLSPKEDDDFALNETSLLTNGLKPMFATINGVGFLIGILATIVGAFGIANIMFVSVRERTNIIGIQKSLGSKNYFILLQFLLEAIILSMIGALIGLILVYLISVFATSAFDFNFTLQANNAFLGIFIAAIVGLISGIVPAYIASKMNPVDAIRSNG